MSHRDKSDFGAGKILPEELADAAAPVERGAHFRPEEPDAVVDEPVEPTRPPKHVKPAEDDAGASS